MTYTRITVPLSQAEEYALCQVASRECRRPQEQARYIILRSLGLVGDTEQPTPALVARETTVKNKT